MVRAIEPEDGKLPPQAPELEQAVLGAILLNSKALVEVVDLLRPEVFYVEAHRMIYAAIEALYVKGLPVDVLTVFQCLHDSGESDRVGGSFYIAQLTNKVASTAHLQYHAMIVIEKYIAREVIRLNTEGARRGYEGGEDPFELVSSTIGELEKAVASNLKKRASSYADAEAREVEAMDAPKRALHTTGFRSLDKVLGGWQRGDLAIIAGRPGMGKSSLATSCVLEAVEAGHPTALFSLELNESKMQARLFSRRSGVPLSRIVRDEMTPEDIAKRHNSLSTSKSLPLWIRYDIGISVEDIRAEATRMVRHNKVSCIVIDQLNWIKPPKAQNRDAEVGGITRALKQIAIELDIAVVLLHQLSRAVETRSGSKIPQLSDLRDSGNVEQDAQVVCFVYRPEYYSITEDEHGSTIGLVEVIVAKNSNGHCETVRLRFRNETASVHELETTFEPPPFDPRIPSPNNRIEPNEDKAPF